MARDIETLYVQLGYSPGQADCILEYLERHRLEEGGRYRLLCPDTGEEDDEPEWVSAVVYSHPWSSDYLMDESTIMCSLRFNTCMPGIDRVMVSPEFDFNWDAVWAELAAIELAALGETIHGRALSPKKQIAASMPIDEAESTGILAESVNFPLRVSLSYSPEDFTRLLTCIKRHEFPFRGRYDLPSEMRDDAEVDLAVFKITVFSGRPFGAKGPSPARLLCSLGFHRDKQAIDLLEPAEGSDIETAWAALADLEEAALGKTIHGKHPVHQGGEQP